MNLAVYNITLDINKTGSQVFLPMRRGDTGRKIVASLCENGIPYKLEGCSAVFTAVKPDGKFIYNDCEVDVENNVIIYPMTLQTTAAEGMVNCQFKLIGNDGKVIATPEFGITVEKTVYNEEPIVESSEEFTALTSLYAEISNKLANGELKGDKGDPGETPTDCVLKSDVLSVVSDENYDAVERPINTQAVVNYTQRELGNYLTSTELSRVFADGEISAINILYSTDQNDPKTIKEKVDYLEGTIGDIDSVLDELHNYAQALIGGEA